MLLPPSAQVTKSSYHGPYFLGGGSTAIRPGMVPVCTNWIDTVGWDTGYRAKATTPLPPATTNVHLREQQASLMASNKLTSTSSKLPSLRAEAAAAAALAVASSASAEASLAPARAAAAAATDSLAASSAARTSRFSSFVSEDTAR